MKKKFEEERKREKESRESVRLYLKFSASVGTFLGCSLVAALVASPGYKPSGNQQIVMRGHIMKRQWLLQLADCWLEWEGEGEEREGVEEEISGVKLKTRKDGTWEVEGLSV